MDCREARHHWNLYHDSEGDARLHLELEEHLGACPACAEWFFRQTHLESQLKERLRPGGPTGTLWEGVLTRVGLRQRNPMRRWLPLWMGAAAAALLVWLFWPATPVGTDLAALSADWHGRLSSGQERVEFVSQSDQEVEQYLRQRVTFPVRCPPRKDAGFAVQGAGVGQLGAFHAAYLTGEVASAPVSIFVLPRDSLSSFPTQEQALVGTSVYHERTAGYDLVVRAFDRNAIVVIGQTSPAALERIVNAYGTYPDHH